MIAALAWQARGGLRPLLAFYGLRHLAVRPPYWLAGLAGGVVSLFVASNVDTISAVYQLSLDEQIEVQTWGFCALLVFVMGAVLGCVAPWALFGEKGPESSRASGRAPTARQSAAPAKNSFAALEDWVKDDQPISSEERDLFGHQQIARRIVDRLTSTAPGNYAEDMSQAIVGRLGSGKTSILHLVRRELEHRRRNDIELIEVQMWPYETARAAVVGIIDRLVEALGEHVNVVSLRGVSGAYAEAISAAPGGSVLRAALRSRAEQPAEALSAMDDIARVIGVRYVVWVEDLERFVTGDAGDEKLGLVRALLHGLHRLPSFTVITATTELSHRLDLDKIARYVERVPELRPQVVRQLCGRFLSQWRQQATDRGCIVVDEPIDWPQTEHAYRYAKALLGHDAFDVPSAVDQLLTTPRVLKQSLRRCDEAWALLAGEVNLDEMLAMSIVRESLPRAYGLIEAHLDRLRDPPTSHLKDNPDPILALKDDLQKELASEPRSVLEAVTALAKEVFSGQWQKRLQGLSVRAAHVDYWERFSALPELPADARDQQVLVALCSPNVDDALDILEDDTYGGPAAVHLASRVPWERLVPLLVPLVRRRLAEPSQQGENEDRPGRPRGFLSFWNILRVHWRKRESMAELVAPIGEAIDICTQSYGLNILPDLEDLFFRVRETQAVDVEPLLSPAEIAPLRQRALDGLVRHVTDPRRLIAALNGTDRWTLRHCVWGVGTRPDAYTDVSSVPFPAWPTLASVVLDALDLAPNTMALQIAPIIFTQVDSYSEQWRFDTAVCRTYFGDVERVVTAIARSDAGNKFMFAIHAALEPWNARFALLRILRLKGTAEMAQTVESLSAAKVADDAQDAGTPVAAPAHRSTDPVAAEVGTVSDLAAPVVDEVVSARELTDPVADEPPAPSEAPN
jgi:hypothetical protein